MKGNFLVIIAIVAWLPVVFAMMCSIRGHRGVAWCLVIGWLFLPVTQIRVAGLPDVDKHLLVVVGVLVAAAVVEPGPLLRLRPRFVDLPMAVWCFCPFLSSISNGLGAYDGMSATVDHLTLWGLPYVLGRGYFTTLDAANDLVRIVIIAGLIYVPLCLWEVKMSPQLHDNIFGFHQTTFRYQVRYEGWRPMVFMSTGLMLGFWMAMTTVVSAWSKAAGATRLPFGLRPSLALAALAVTTVLCKSTFAILAMVGGVVTAWTVKQFRLSLIVWAIVLAPPGYTMARYGQGWNAQVLIEAAGLLGEQRAESIRTRIVSEGVLINHAMKRPIFGWGGWGRSLVENERGRKVLVTETGEKLKAIPDALFVTALGRNGLVGGISVMATFLLPGIIVLCRLPIARWLDPGVASVVTLAVVVALYMSDCMLNAMPNPVYPFMAGVSAPLAAQLGRMFAAGARPVRAGSNPGLQLN